MMENLIKLTLTGLFLAVCVPLFLWLKHKTTRCPQCKTGHIYEEPYSWKKTEYHCDSCDYTAHEY